jgi:hypothetical protein
LFKGRTSPGPLARFRYNCESNGWAFQRQKHSRDVFRLQARDGRPIYQQQSVAWKNFSTGAAQSVRIGGCGHVCEWVRVSQEVHTPRNAPDDVNGKELTPETRNLPRAHHSCPFQTILQCYLPAMQAPLPSTFFHQIITLHAKQQHLWSPKHSANTALTASRFVVKSATTAPPIELLPAPFPPCIHIRGFHAAIVRSGCVDGCVAAVGRDAVTNIHACDD